jgi:signal transduction histidine kinase
MRLRTRLFALVSVAVAVTVVLVTWAVSSSARNAFAEVDAQRTSALVAQFRREFSSQADQIAAGVERLASSDALRRTAADAGRTGADRAAYVDEATSLAAAQGWDLLDLVTDEGTIVSSAQWPARFGYTHPWATAAIGERRAFLQTIELPHETALGLVAVRKVAARDGGLIVAGGRRLDPSFLQTLVLPAGMRALLYRNVEPEVSRQQLIDASGQVAQSAQLEPLIARVRQSGHEAAETIDWPDGPERVDAIPLAGRDGTTRGVLLVGSSGRELAALVSRIRWTGIAFGALGLAGGFILSYVVAARVTRPVEQLAEASRSVAGGDWNVTVGDVQASGEIEELARAFDAMTKQLADQRARLIQTERVAAWRELARRLAHELKNPLFPLRVTLDNMRRAKALPGAEFDEVFDESLTTMTSGLANLNTVIARFSDFARMPPPEFAPVAPNDVVRQSVQLFRAQLEAPGRPAIALAVDLDDSLQTIRADGEQLSRAVQNLLLNAIDAMPSGGELVVRTRRVNGGVRIEVSDTGDGLTEEERQRLFTPYYTTKHHGTGLGLAIVQSVVADHSGKVWVVSERGRGATFHIEIPSASGQEIE